MESKTDNRSFDCLLEMAFDLMPKTTSRNLLFYSNGQLLDYAKDKSNPDKERACCIAELFAREFLKKGKAREEINSILTEKELESFWSKVGEDYLDVHEKKDFPLDVLWDSQNDFSRFCEIIVREKLRALCEDIDGLIPVFLDSQAYFIPFNLKRTENKTEKGTIVDLAGTPIHVWQVPYSRLFSESQYQCIVHCDQSGLLQGPNQKNVFKGYSLMFPLYLAFLRKEEKLAYNPLCLIATGEFDENGRLKPVQTKEKANGFHSCFNNKSFFVYPENTEYYALEQNEIALPKINLVQVEEYFRARGLFVRAKQDREESLCSIRPAMSKSFVGRWEELMNLNKQIYGHIPVITGGAGVGKTELAVAYADLYGENFPQGRFMIPMQGIHSWTDAMGKMIEWFNVCGIMTEQLDLPDGFNKLSPDEKKRIAYRMLSSRATKGPLLLLLDNLEELSLISDSGLQELTGPAGLPSNLYVYATTRIREACGLAVQMPVEMEIGNLKERDALELFCKICGNTFRFTKYPMSKGKLLLDRIPEAYRPTQEQILDVEQEYAALQEIICLLKGHVWSLEIVAGRLASHARKFGKDNIRKEWNEIQKSLTDTLKGKTYRSGENNAEMLLKPTIDLILKKSEHTDELGQMTMRLAEFASFLPPEQVPEYALGRLWKQEFGNKAINLELDNIPLMGNDAYDYALMQLKNYRIINGDEPIFKMHRLTQAGLKQIMQKDGTFDGCVEKIASNLAGTQAIPNDFYIETISSSPEIAVHLKKKYPQFFSALLSPKAWVKMLSAEPFSTILTELCPWDILSGEDWSNLLIKQPSFMAKCQFSRLNEDDWVWLLKEQPQFADRCPWNILGGSAWAHLLEKQPQFADKCPWDRLNGFSWASLLKEQPQFANECLWAKLAGRDWAELLGSQPQFAYMCPWDKLNEYDWASLLGCQPQFADKCPWNKLNDFTWARLLECQPQFMDKCQGDRMKDFNWASFLRDQPQFADKCPWNKLNDEDWAWLLECQPQFANQCNKWDKLQGRDWAWLLRSQPQFANKCNWDKLDGENWAILLWNQPQFADKCNWDKLDGENWTDLLLYKPLFADKCKWGKLNGENWAKLLAEQPQFANKCNWDKLDGENWADLLWSQPQFADKCNWDKLDGENWVDLLWGQPQFAVQCSWNKLNGEDWAELLVEQSQFADKCKWRKLNGRNWIRLLLSRPEYADKCDWSKLDGEDWVELMEEQPLLVRQCPWGKLVMKIILAIIPGEYWVKILCQRPEYADLCKWNKLDSYEWRDLLKEQPQFADRCPKDKQNRKN